MIKKIKSENGFTTIDATIAIIIVSLALVLISSIVYNTYLQVLSTHKSAMSTFYLVQVLEKANKLDYNDINLNEGILTSEGENQILDIPIDANYVVTLNIKKYNKTEGNTDKLDLIKILEAKVSYTDNKLQKDIIIKTLKASR